VSAEPVETTDVSPCRRVVAETAGLNAAGNVPNVRRRHLCGEERGTHAGRDGHDRIHTVNVQEASDSPFFQGVVHPSRHNSFSSRMGYPRAQGVRSGGMEVDEIIAVSCHQTAQTEAREQVARVPHPQRARRKPGGGERAVEGALRISGDHRVVPGAGKIGRQTQHLALAPAPVLLRIDVQNSEPVHSHARGCILAAWRT
jgi:hypothetical protein